MRKGTGDLSLDAILRVSLMVIVILVASGVILAGGSSMQTAVEDIKGLTGETQITDAQGFADALSCAAIQCDTKLDTITKCTTAKNAAIETENIRNACICTDGNKNCGAKKEFQYVGIDPLYLTAFDVASGISCAGIAGCIDFTSNDIYVHQGDLSAEGIDLTMIAPYQSGTKQSETEWLFKRIIRTSETDPDKAMFSANEEIAISTFLNEDDYVAHEDSADTPAGVAVVYPNSKISFAGNKDRKSIVMYLDERPETAKNCKLWSDTIEVREDPDRPGIIHPEDKICVLKAFEKCWQKVSIESSGICYTIKPETTLTYPGFFKDVLAFVGKEDIVQVFNGMPENYARKDNIYWLRDGYKIKDSGFIQISDDYLLSLKIREGGVVFEANKEFEDPNVLGSRKVVEVLPASGVVECGDGICSDTENTATCNVDCKCAIPRLTSDTGTNEILRLSADKTEAVECLTQAAQTCYSRHYEDPKTTACYTNIHTSDDERLTLEGASREILQDLQAGGVTYLTIDSEPPNSGRNSHEGEDLWLDGPSVVFYDPYPLKTVVDSPDFNIPVGYVVEVGFKDISATFNDGVYLKIKTG